ncbi:hypothetical protein DV495_000347 [Geotrichum candidum]|nr:hypothetical protein DV452_001873 [Geotrichum candidum]KAF5135926.1 hypothetical protein DV495_000347 [Geotrichum candidum]KAF7500242.1 hypothetical protein DV113_001708 [Geotrichum candidum]KAI8135929.1 hypothetical protein DUD61_000352 [Geotrichum candidum]
MSAKTSAATTTATITTTTPQAISSVSPSPSPKPASASAAQSDQNGYNSYDDYDSAIDDYYAAQDGAQPSNPESYIATAIDPSTPDIPPPRRTRTRPKNSSYDSDQLTFTDSYVGIASSTPPEPESDNDSNSIHMIEDLSDSIDDSDPDSSATAAAMMAQEMSAVQALKRLSIGASLALDPDLPNYSSGIYRSGSMSSISNNSYRTAKDSSGFDFSSSRPTRSISAPSVPSFSQARREMSQNSQRPEINSKQASQLLWVPAHVHPEIAPQQWKSFVHNKLAEIQSSQESKSDNGKTFKRIGNNTKINRKWIQHFCISSSNSFNNSNFSSNNFNSNNFNSSNFNNNNIIIINSSSSLNNNNNISSSSSTYNNTNTNNNICSSITTPNNNINTIKNNSICIISNSNNSTTKISTSSMVMPLLSTLNQDSMGLEKFTTGMRLDDVVGNEETVERLKVIARDGNMPHLIISQKVNLPAGRQKIVILDEADSMTAGAQQALRRTMELASGTTRFAFACNLSNKIIEPLQSRCAVLRYSKLTDQQVLKRLLEIIKLENVQYSDDGLSALIFSAEGDMRQAINNLQSTVSGFGFVSGDNVFKVVDSPHPIVVQAILKACNQGDIDAALLSLKQLWDKGYSAVDIISTMFRVTKFLPDLSEATKLEFIKVIGFTHMRVLDGVSTYLQLSGCLAKLCKLKM